MHAMLPLRQTHGSIRLSLFLLLVASLLLLQLRLPHLVELPLEVDIPFAQTFVFLHKLRDAL